MIPQHQRPRPLASSGPTSRKSIFFIDNNTQPTPIYTPYNSMTHNQTPSAKGTFSLAYIEPKRLTNIIYHEPDSSTLKDTSGLQLNTQSGLTPTWS
jgi:hypothetical protein